MALIGSHGGESSRRGGRGCGLGCASYAIKGRRATLVLRWLRGRRRSRDRVRPGARAGGKIQCEGLWLLFGQRLVHQHIT